MKKLLDFDWLRAVQFKCNTHQCKECNTSANYNEDFQSQSEETTVNASEGHPRCSENNRS